MLIVDSNMSLNEVVECVEKLEIFCHDYSKALWENYYITDSKNGDPEIGKAIDINYNMLDSLADFRKHLDSFFGSIGD